MGEIDRRRRFSRKRVKSLVNSLTGAAASISGKACVYLTGSFGREEAGNASDLDLFIVGASGGEVSKRLLSRLDEICLKAELIRAARKLQFPEFSGDGEFLQFHTVDELVGGLGTSTDDSQNTFTARLLLVLESRCLLGDEIYQAAIDSVLAKYWRDFADHAENFAPAFLANDILRLWRTFCVNYEARTETEPPEKKARRSLKNYKLKHSRLLTCYSGILFLLAVYSSNRTVRPGDAFKMVRLSPTQRCVSMKVRHLGGEFKELFPPFSAG